MRQALFLASALVVVGPIVAHAKEANRVLGIDVDKRDTDRVVRIRTQSSPTFTVFRLTDPMRVVVDISGGDASGVNPVSVDDGVLEQIGVRQFAADGFSIARVVVGFAAETPYDVRAEGNAVVVSTGKGAAVTARVAPPPPAQDTSAAAAALERQRREFERAAQIAAEKNAAELAKAQALQSAAERAAREAERAAAEAERKKRESAEAAAQAEAKRKQELADLAAQKAAAQAQKEAAESQRAAAENERRAAEEARLAAAQAKQKALDEQRAAEEARLAAEKARQAAEKARSETAQKVTELKAREEALLAEQRRVEEERKRLSQTTAAVDKARKEVQAHKPLSTPELVTAAPKKPAVASLGSAPTASRQSYRLSAVRTSSRGKETLVALKLDGVPAYDVERLSSPPRLVVDLASTKPTSKRAIYPTKSSVVTKVRLGEHGDKLRAVFDLAGEDVQHAIEKGEEGLVVAFKRVTQQHAATPSVRSELPPASLDPTERAVADAVQDTAAASLRDVRFTAQGQRARVVIDVSANVTALVDDRSQKSWVLQLRDTTVPKNLERSLDASAYGTAVRLISTYQASVSPPVVNIVASLSGPATSKLNQEGDKLIWEIESEAVREPLASSATGAAAGFASQATTLSQTLPKQAQRRVNMRLKDADLVNVIRFIADVTGENIIVSEDVKGKVTVNLRNVPWEQALDMILKTRGYDKVRQNNILRIATLEQIQREKEAEIARKKAQAEVEDTVVRIIAINYAIAKEISEQLKPSLSPRGSIQVDDRTNTIIAEDLRDNLDRIIELTKRLDRQTPQVLIEARIVEAASNYQQELGIQWGGTGQATGNTGNPTGLAFPGDVRLSGAADPGNTTGTGNPGQYAVNLPAPIGATFGSGIGFIFGSASGNQLLNLRLTALESNGSGRIISSPRVTTLDNKTARIAQGVDIPISVVSAQGVNTRFIPANLELEVTPHVTNDGSVLLKIKTAKNEPDFQRVGGQGDPTIVKKFAETEVMVRDGDTAVIGGIYTRNTAERFNEVPFLSKIPILGWLFKNRRQTDDRAELLVFITPRIVNRDESMLVSDASMTHDSGELPQGD